MKNSSPTCSIILPVYNEEVSLSATLDRIKKVIEEIPGYKFEIVCIDDGSIDQTPRILKSRRGIRVVTHRRNRGYGAALRTGINSSSSEWIFIVDADGTYPLEDLPVLVGQIDEEVDMVVGAREGAGISKNPLRQCARWILRRMVYALTGVMVPDLNSGMRLFRRSLYVEFKHLLPFGFSFTSTLTVASLYLGYGVRYIPIQYGIRTGKSSIRPVSDFLTFTMLIIRLASYFEPLRFFLPFSFFVFIAGLLKGIRDIIVTNAIGSLSVILLSLAIQVFITGVIADVIVKRSLFLSRLSDEADQENRFSE